MQDEKFPRNFLPLISTDRKNYRGFARMIADSSKTYHAGTGKTKKIPPLIHVKISGKQFWS